MEFYDNDFLEELMALRRETFNTNPSIEENEFFSNGYSFDCFEQNSSTFLLNNTLCGQEFPQSYNNEYNTFNEINNTLDTPLNTTSFLGQEDFSFSMIEGEDNTCFLGEELQNLELQNTCKMEPTLSPEMAVFNIGTGLERKNRSKKLQGQPSKNLMAERRRRKRLNDRLSMLRSIVPKISKMDRTSILGDTIDYMKELLDKINNLQQEIEVDANMTGIFKDVKPNEILIRNSPKFEVERNLDTRVEICCVGKPGLLLSTVNTLEALGLEIQQCVISCFNDFSMQASCSEELEQRTMLSSEDIKQALFRSAGYGGKCL
ncbi:PREDICTED: transcription factor bHLH93-like isoform X2 [Lupinus angustifolius]|uniref:transcription factor bHLH93-like isoform X2 n=1 Tax=Lupinus angustifolius TaxID=3871 RepID=UPI00092E4D07|nr:PREDICTED: transcription factor bHLH93-like isoform X2 [Lupinus angustifolius]